MNTVTDLFNQPESRVTGHSKETLQSLRPLTWFMSISVGMWKKNASKWKAKKGEYRREWGETGDSNSGSAVVCVIQLVSSSCSLGPSDRNILISCYYLSHCFLTPAPDWRPTMSSGSVRTGQKVLTETQVGPHKPRTTTAHTHHGYPG